MESISQPVVFWFRRDLRLADNPALRWAADTGRPIICIYIHDAENLSIGSASKWWLHHSLKSLSASIEGCGAELHLFTGKTEDVIERVLTKTKARCIAWNRRYEPDSIKLDKKIKADLQAKDIMVYSAAGNLCHEPWTVAREGKHPYKVFTAYWRASLKHESQPISPKVTKLSHYDKKVPGTVALKKLALLPTRDWADEFDSMWIPGEKGADRALKRSVESRIADYDTARDIPAVAGTSQLSPHLAFGEISPRQINATIARKVAEGSLIDDDNTETFRKEIGWREFAYHLMYHFPPTIDGPLDVRFENFPWKKVSKKTLGRWQHGQTGIPLVDAGMRQLWQTGWMHNRVRMVVGSLLIKNMGYHWQHGADWFWDTLLDADLASNTMGWQWVAGSGADAAPYFRVFNPVRQGERFDPEGKYVRHWVPEIANLPNKHIHSPWTASPTELQEAAIMLGKTYPKPIVDLKVTRKDALDRFAAIKTPA